MLEGGLSGLFGVSGGRAVRSGGTGSWGEGRSGSVLRLLPCYLTPDNVSVWMCLFLV